MKKLLFLLVLLFGLSTSVFSQSALESLNNDGRDFLYVTATVGTKAEVNALSANFSVDNCLFDERSGQFLVRIYLSRPEYEAFATQNIPFEIITPERPPAGDMVATTMTEMAQWNKYPSYEIYVQMMHDFQTNFPNLCKIDTILAATPCTSRPHMILAAHLSNSLGQPADKPAFLYTSTMHGDEVVGFYMMLRLIDYILNNATTDADVQNILQNVDLYICPLENPDGTYHSSNTDISSSASQRYNWNNVDMNRNYPFLPGINGSANVQPETQAIINWVSDKHFVMSANFHGGAELTNFPWDSWESNSRTHADDNWYRYVCQNYVDTCHVYDDTYMVGETYYQPGCGPVTEGGDWYVITGSRQDYMNYYQHCREVTIEAHFDKVCTSTTELPTYWTNSKSSLLHFAMECLNGFRGIVTDAVTGEPIEAKIFVRNHDTFNSEVYSHLPIGNYHRPIKAGTYTVEVSADCYETQTFTVTTTDGACVRHNIQLVPLVSAPQVADQHIMTGESATLSTTSTHTINWYANENDNTPISTGLTFTTPALTETTTYFVEESAVDNGTTCRSERTQVTVFVDDPHSTVYSDASYTRCGSFTYEGETYTESGDYEILYPEAAADQSDSILRLHLTIYPTYSINVSFSVMEGDSYNIEGDPYIATASGVYTYDRYHLSVNGCDSVMHYFVYVTSPTIAFQDTTIEACSPFIYEGEVLMMDGDYTFYYPNAGVGGCDSMLLIHLTLYPSYSQTVDIELGLGESYWIGNEEIVGMVEGIYEYDEVLSSIHNCDSVIHYRILIGNVGVSDQQVKEYSIYPNPANDVCYISGNTSDAPTIITLMDASGRKIYETTMTESPFQVDLSNLSAGYYFIHIRKKGEETIKKIIKQ